MPESRIYTRGVSARCMRFVCAASIAFCAVFSGTPAQAVHMDRLTIAAANSTCTAIKAVGAAFAASNNIEMDYICKSSGRLAKGLKGGVITADYYISANAKWMDDMVSAGFVDRGEVKTFWGNELVVATPRGSSLELTSLTDLAAAKVKTVFLGDPSTAPFGRYAKQALGNSGLWEDVKQKVVTHKHITLLANNLAQAGDGVVGILFSTNVSPELRRLFAVEKGLHDPIQYFSGPLISTTEHPYVDKFEAFLTTDVAQDLFRRQGFQILP